MAEISSPKTPIIAKIDHGKVETAKLKRSADGADIVLDVPEETISRDRLPAVTIVTITRNRRRFASLIIDNWQRVYYPDTKIFLLIVDDSDDVKQGPILEIKALKDPRISYYYMAPKKGDDGKLEGHSIGYKRNFAMGLIKTDYAAMVDDDDMLYGESILSRMCCLMYYGKECVYSNELGIYDIPNESSYVLEGFDDVPEGTIMFSKKFWEKQKFGEVSRGEGIQLVSGRELDMIKIPYFFSLIVLNHKSNTTGRGRSMRFKPSRQFKNRVSTGGAPINFFKLFPESFKNALKELAKA